MDDKWYRRLEHLVCFALGSAGTVYFYELREPKERVVFYEVQKVDEKEELRQFLVFAEQAEREKKLVDFKKKAEMFKRLPKEDIYELGLENLVVQETRPYRILGKGEDLFFYVYELDIRMEVDTYEDIIKQELYRKDKRIYLKDLTKEERFILNDAYEQFKEDVVRTAVDLAIK